MLLCSSLIDQDCHLTPSSWSSSRLEKGSRNAEMPAVLLIASPPQKRKEDLEHVLEKDKVITSATDRESVELQKTV